MHGGTPDAGLDDRQLQLAAVKRWYYSNWIRLEPRLRSSIVEGIVVFLSLFDDNPTVGARVLSAEDRRTPTRPRPARSTAQPLPPLDELAGERKGARAELPRRPESGPGARVGRHAETGLPARRPVAHRPDCGRAGQDRGAIVLFVCDEYHAFATTGDTDPSGDERTFALSRQARLIPIVATQSISSLRSAVHGEESWRTLLQCFRTKIFLASSDEFTAKVAAELCGRAERLKPSYQLTEAGQDARVSLLTGRAAAPKSTVTASKHYAFQMDYVFQPKIFGELQNAQADRAAVRRAEPEAADVLLPEAALPRRADQLLRSRRARRAVSSFARILPFVRPLEHLLLDPGVTEVMVNAGGRRVFVERAGQLRGGAGSRARRAESEGRDQEHRAHVRRRDFGPATDPRCAAGGRLARRRDVPAVFGERADAHDPEIHAPLLARRARRRRHPDRRSWRPRSRDAVQAHRNILISGGTGTGKTTLLNALAATIADDDRIVLIEETSEIADRQAEPRALRGAARAGAARTGRRRCRPSPSPNCLRATLRHRPDRILVGEVRGAEAFDLLQALNTGHLGSLSTLHANSAEQALTRFAHCVLTANVGLPHASIREAIALAIHLVAHIARDGGRRRVTELVAVRGYCAQDRHVRPDHALSGRRDTMTTLDARAPGRRGQPGRRLPGVATARAPTSPSPPASFLAGTWRGTVTIEADRPAGEQRADHVDVRGRAAIQSAELRRDHPVGAPVAADHACRASPTSRRPRRPPRRSARRASYSSPRGCRGDSSGASARPRPPGSKPASTGPTAMTRRSTAESRSRRT